MLRIFCPTCERVTPTQRTYLDFFCTRCNGAAEHIGATTCTRRACECTAALAQIEAGL
jgi:hypothetical protein